MTLWLNVCGSGGCVVRPPTSKYFIVRPPEGRCGYGSEQTVILPAKVFVRADPVNTHARPK